MRGSESAPENEALRAIAERFLTAARSANTLKSYEWAWRNFCAWSETNGYCCLPAAEDTVLLWASSLIGAGRKVSSTSAMVAAVAYYHRQAGQRSPVGDKVRLMLAGARRVLREVPRQKRPLTIAQLGRISAKLNTGDPVDARTRALIVLGFAGAFRCSELRNLNMDDIEFVDRGLVIQLWYSKTDQQGRGRSVCVFRGKNPDTCPVCVLEGWLLIRGRGPGPLFVPTSGSQFTNRRMGIGQIERSIHLGFDRDGLSRRAYAGHSLRAGYVTAAAENGATEMEIMRQTGHKSSEMVHRYFRPVKGFGRNPLKNLL